MKWIKDAKLKNQVRAKKEIYDFKDHVKKKSLEIKSKNKT